MAGTQPIGLFFLFYKLHLGNVLRLTLFLHLDCSIQTFSKKSCLFSFAPPGMKITMGRVCQGARSWNLSYKFVLIVGNFSSTLHVGRHTVG